MRIAFIFGDMQREPPKLHERSVAEVAPHIPQDSGNGLWSTTEVRVK